MSTSVLEWKQYVVELLALISERVEHDNVAVPTEDGPMCAMCGAEWEYDGDTPNVKPGTEWHQSDCWVVRALEVTSRAKVAD